MRILLSTHHTLDPDTGASGTAIALGQAYRELGHEVRMLSFDDLPKMPGRAAALAYPYRVAQALGSPRTSDLDVVDSSTGDTWLWGMRRRPHPAPLLVTRSHGLDQLRYRATLEYEARRHGRRPSFRHRAYAGHWRLWEIGRSLRQSDLVLTLNADEREFAIEELGIAPDRLELVANPVPENILAAGAEVNRSGGARDIAYVGAYREMKGVEYGTAAIVDVLQHHPDVTMAYIGVGSAGADPRGISGRPARPRADRAATYARSELPRLLEGSGILLFPSLSEGFGNVIVETMACGLTPVASDTGGAKQIVENGKNGLLVPRYSVGELAEAVKLLLGDEELRRRLQASARASSARYALTGIAERNLDLYHEGLARRTAELGG